MVKGMEWKATFKVFKSNGAWAMLFGKPLLKIFNAVHNYKEDTIQIPQKEGTGWAILKNQYADKQGFAGKLLANLTVDIKQLIAVPQPISAAGIVAKLSRTGEQKKQKYNSKVYKLCGGLTTPFEGSSAIKPCGVTETHIADTVISPDISIQEQKISVPKKSWSSMWLLDEAAGKSQTHPGMEQPDIAKVFKLTLLTRKTDPYNPACVEAIISEVIIGQDLSPEERLKVQDLILEFADCFTLSMSEVTPVNGAEY